METQPATPHLTGTEKGRTLAPTYGSELVEFDIFPNEWIHLCSARFGEARVAWTSPLTKKNTEWTGDSYRYDIYVSNDEAKRLIALRWQNGGGSGWLVTEDRARRDELSLLRIIAELPTEARRWDGCHQVYETATKSALAAAAAESRRYSVAFAEGRLKKHRRKGAIKVTLEPKVIGA